MPGIKYLQNKHKTPIKRTKIAMCGPLRPQEAISGTAPAFMMPREYKAPPFMYLHLSFSLIFFKKTHKHLV